MTLSPIRLVVLDKGMTFLLPLGLLAFLTIPIILVLHLLRERRRRVAVPSLMHWLNVPQRREGERIRRLPLTLLLLLHLLVAGLLALALGQPQLAGAPGGAARQTIIVLDTSTSMAARSGTTTRFAQAQAKATELLRQLRPDDRATIVAAGPRAHIVAQGGAGDLAALAAAVGQLRPGGDGADLAGAITLAAADLDAQRERRIIAISDGGAPGAEPPANAPLTWQTVGSEQGNRAIVGFAARLWGGKLQVYARVANYDAAAFRAALQLYGDERLVDTRDLDIAADGEAELTWTLPTDYRTLRAALDARDALPEDDQSFLAVAKPRPIAARLVSSRPDQLRRALAAAGVQATVVDPSRYDESRAAQPNVDLTIFDSFLPQEWPGGAALAINPPPDNPLLGDGISAVTAPADGLRQTGAVLEGLSFGGVDFGLSQPLSTPTWAAAQLSRGGEPLILRGRDGAHELAIWNFDLASGNLPTRLAFPLLVARTVRDLVPTSLPAALQAGGALTLRPDPRATSIEITAPDGARSTVPATTTVVLDSLTQPGFYRIAAAGQDSLIGVNAGSAIESDLRQQSISPNSAETGRGEESWAPPQLADSRPQRPTDIWPWLVLGALALLMLEWGYIHR
jgi:hypothetical protein